jgi:hypothetical protein
MSEPSAKDYREVIQRAVAALGKLPEVHSVGLGGRMRNGQPTGELVLKVFVSTKRDPSSLSPSELVPKEFEGIPTDVMEGPEPHPAAAPAGAVLGGPYSVDVGRQRPLRGGMQLAGEHCVGKGTIGFFARIDEPTPRIVAVTAHHALFSNAAAEEPNMRVGSPTADDSVSDCCRDIFGSFLKGYRDASMDIAIIKVEAKQTYYPQIEDIGVVNGQHDITAAEAATTTFPVRKRGRTTRVTGGTVQGIGVTHVSGTPANYMVIKPNASASGTATFADWGDSGAAIVNDANDIVGVLFGMSSLTAGQPEAGWGFAWAIADVFARFMADGIELGVAAGTTLNEERTVLVSPFDAVAGAQPRVVSEPMQVARKLETDLSHSELGRLVTALWVRHLEELRTLVNGNVRVATKWKRTGGAALLQHALRSAYSPDVPVPYTIDGRATDECLRDVLDLFEKYGSYGLKHDIGAYRDLLPPVAGKSYNEILASLDSPPEGESPWLH